MAKEDETPHYHGHRDRLRQRFIEGGESALQDYELLELLLFLAIPRRDVKPLAKALIKTFRSFASVLSAPLSELQKIEGVSANTAIALKSVAAAGRLMTRQEAQAQPVLNAWSKLVDYLMASMAHEMTEQFRVVFLNRKNFIIADEVQSEGTIDHTQAYPREIMKRALELGASAIILVHNHPSGSLKPSQDDLDMTAAIVRAAVPFEIRVHDHVIITKTGYASFKNMGLL
ncbi:MAG: DNA repair protein RadC [Alphaproteobacteria bacterium]|nr:DNA repair protein RadC [Alphaproteobacteria bacterium]